MTTELIANAAGPTTFFWRGGHTIPPRRIPERLGEINPNAAAIIAVNPHSNVVDVTRVNGITTVIATLRSG